MRGGMIGDLIQIVPSSALSDSMILLDAKGVVGVNDILLLDVTTHASISASDNPTSGATELLSLWQANMAGVKATRYFATQVLRSDAVAVISSVTA